MGFFVMKVLITSILVVTISEISKKSSFLGALLASIPLISVMAMIWLYIETKDLLKVATLSISVFWLVIPSLALFLILPVLLKSGMNFYLSMIISMSVTGGFYYLLFFMLRKLGISL